MKRVRWGLGMVALAALSGCIVQPKPKVVKGEPYPDPHAKTQEEHRDLGAPKTEAVLSANALDVTLNQPTECRDQTPMVRDVTTERHANGWEQVVNAGGFLVLGGAGIAAMASPCTVTPAATQADPNPPSRPCTSDEKQSRKLTGGVVIGTGALFGAAFIYNIIKARDSKETLPVHTEREWKICAARPVASSSLHLDLADGQQLVQTTNAEGQAHFDLTKARWTDEALKAGQARLTSGGHTLSSVDLSSLPQYAEWQKRRAQAATQRQQEDAARLKRDQEADAVLVAKVKKWARTAISVSWSPKMFSWEKCVNRVDTEVPCASAAAFKRVSDSGWKTTIVVHNKSRVKLRCQAKSRFGESSDGGWTDVAPARSYTVRTVDHRMRTTAQLLAGGNFLLEATCIAPLRDVVSSRGFGQQPHDTKDWIVVIGYDYDLDYHKARQSVVVGPVSSP